MKKTTIAANRLITYIKGLIKEDKIDINKNFEAIMLLFDESNFIKTSPQERIALLKRVTSSVRHRLDLELEEADTVKNDITEFKKEPYISEHKEIIGMPNNIEYERI